MLSRRWRTTTTLLWGVLLAEGGGRPSWGFLPPPPPRHHRSASQRGIPAATTTTGPENEEEEEATPSTEVPLALESIPCPACEEPLRQGAAAETIEGRLLCAAECAYGIRGPYFRGVGYREGTTARKISRGVNSCLVGRTTDGIVVAFRGTVAGSPLDWLQNAALYLRDVQGVPGRVHSGFYNAVRSLWPALKGVLLEQIRDEQAASSSNPTPKIYLTGHSKGGSMASLAALLLHEDPGLPGPSLVCSFGGARVGDAAFRASFDATVRQATYENDLDIIPFLPPGKDSYEDMMGAEMKDMVDDILWSKAQRAANRRKTTWRYQSIGSRRYIDPSGLVVDPVTEDLDYRRIREIEAKTLLKFSEFRRAHCSACPDDACSGGYFSAVAPEICLEKESTG